MADLLKPIPSTLEEAFGQILRTLREGKEMKQVEVSAATGYSQRTIGMVERGEKSPTLRTMGDFATFYDVPLEDLVIKAKRLRNRAPKQGK
jgi:transcriptional regulator with XRE-family HTH domain